MSESEEVAKHVDCILPSPSLQLKKNYFSTHITVAIEHLWGDFRIEEEVHRCIEYNHTYDNKVVEVGTCKTNEPGISMQS